ncbi:ABC-F family ATP-binding cassette domain-containing protein [Yersinia canariae]|uniref:ABC-F family ATP-binding cassette domain-containing protein n=1 Tax=Yersinia canariae TaxID=2607663 RepID=A0A857F1L5_9GAMM|nr:ABC-F family ATP-binding cassette domain-containing protein [Yersinia canariae]QHB32925.1 ABC-F family ATP-binding cassette domain-containing protein [Yersinia canariae]
MSTLLSAQSVCYNNTFGPLLTEISFSLKKGDRIGLIGHNGCGKSTLLKILSGALSETSGAITVANQCVMATVEQHLPPALNNATLKDAVINHLPDSLHQPEHWQAEVLLTTLGFDETSWSLTAGTLSGGQHTRLLLARALVRQPDLLLLDEPSNHLDLPTLLWLEQFLQNWSGSFVLVSHDRSLLDRVTNCTWILRDKTLQFIRLPCTPARKALEEKDITDINRHQSEQKEIDRVAKSAKRLAIWGSVYDNEKLARKAKQMEKQVERMKGEQTRLTASHQWQLQLHGEALPADRVLALSNLQIRPAPRAPVLFELDEVRVKSGDRIALVGRNGCGKSSLLHRLWQAFHQPETTDTGIVFHPKVRVGYYDQSLQQLHDNDSLNDALVPFAPLTEDQRKMALIGAGFPYLRHQQKVSTLSGGERSRLLFIGLTLANYSLLLLDEPTNHLDMEGKEELAQTLKTFSGAVLLVSHDRTLIEQSCNHFWLIHQQRLENWHDLAAVYNILADKVVMTSSSISAVATEVITAPRESEEECLLTTLLELEAKLAEDLARKPKHQKIILQREWQQQIDQLNKLLDLGSEGNRN